MEVNYQHTTQLNTEILSYKQGFAFISVLSTLPKMALRLAIKILRWMLFRKMDEFSKFLKRNRDIFPNEYYDCLEINDMIKYTLKRDISLTRPEDLEFITDISNSFFDLTTSKLDMIRDNDCRIDETFHDTYNPVYDSFNAELLKYKEYFYANIYNESYDEQDIADYLKIVWEQ